MCYMWLKFYPSFSTSLVFDLLFWGHKLSEGGPLQFYMEFDDLEAHGRNYGEGVFSIPQLL